MRFNHRIVDTYVHAHGLCGVDSCPRNAADHLSESELDGENLLCVKHSSSACITEPEILSVKALNPGHFSVLGNPKFLIPHGFDTTPEGVAEQLQAFLDGGMDRVHMVNGNGGTAVPLDSDIFDPMMTVLDAEEVILLYHVGTFPHSLRCRVFQKTKFGRKF